MNQTRPLLTRVDQSGSPERFGYSWAMFPDVQAEQGVLFDGWVSALPPHTWQNAYILDAGCGNGRNSFWANMRGAKYCMGIDIDGRSIGAAYNNMVLRGIGSSSLQSLYNIGAHRSFDIVMCLGVLHHLAEPSRALSEMVKVCKPGGIILLWVYGKENMGWYVKIMSLVRSGITSRLPMLCNVFIAVIAAVILKVIVQLELSSLEYFSVLRTMSFRHLVLICLDQLLPKIAFHWTGEEIKNMCSQVGLSDIKAVHVNGMSWSISCRVP